MFTWFKKKHKKEPEALENTCGTEATCIDDFEDSEEDSRNIKVLEYFNQQKAEGKVLEVMIQMKSYKDVNIVVIVGNDDVALSRIKFESDFYVKRYLDIKAVNRKNDKILLLTNNDETYNISVVGKEYFDEHYKVKD